MSHKHLIIYLTLALTAFGLVMIGSASVVGAARDFSDKWYYLKLQGMWAGVGLIGFLFMSRFPHRKLEKLAPALMVGTIFLLLVVLIPGVGSKWLGARRWINLGFMSLQPAEVAKITLSIYLASLLKHKQKFTQFIFMLLLTAGLVMLEPDLGTTLVLIGMSVFTYYGAGGKLLHLAMLAPFGVVAVLLLIIVSPYRAERVKTFFDFSHDPQGSSYQIRQALIGFGSGGITGLGLGQSRQKYDFLPEATTDSIFSVIGEELGYGGGLLVIAALALLVYTGLQISKSNSYPFSANLSLSISCLIGVQAFMNLSAITALLPLTGIPLTFISYGGSSLVIFMAAAGILVNIAKTGHEK